ncbi:polysaccharide deacetylase family protein [Pseudarthrobacter sp. NIBRBAC000502770]|uniref:polysaccharide deacetylase family protein n=1 Tax=Pseudarthrobacter sp. NIBRBAC000502770 TaxID=2590785 RepID=UPI00113FCC12|nr:polysaccharide deacetylase family protein [Pseudarthrobacter sp. NIBRBAC000502770]QDG88878.1 hypothetical protein NIBR502770_10610 [Pseudarthrobacter sp. NIBRBAC000502770]
MADVFYPGTLAADPGTVGRSPLPNAVFQVYELTDTAQVNPLPLKDSSGLSITSLTSTNLGVLPPVYVTSPNLSHNWVSGTWVWRRDSFDGAQAAVTAAKNASISGASLSPTGDLTFTTLGGTVIPAGNVKGPQGNPGANSVPTQAAIQSEVTTPGTPTAAALSATYVPKWKATTAYFAGDKVLSPNGDVVSSIADHTSGSSFNQANWNLSATVAAKADKADVLPKWKATTAYLAGDKVLSPSGDIVSAKANFTSGASYSAANWDAVTITPAGVDTKVGAAISAAGAQTPPATALLPPKQKRTMIQTFQSGHGYSSIVGAGGGSVALNDTTDSAIGTQSVKVVTSGTGTTSSIYRFNIPTPFDMTGKQLAMLVKCDDPTHLKTLNIWIGNGGLSATFNFTINNVAPAEQLDAGAWMWVTIPWQQISGGASATIGAPDRAAIAGMQINIADDNTGNPVTLRVQAIASVPVPAVWTTGCLTFDFDDGFATHYTVARKALAKYDYKADVYPVCEAIDSGAAYMTLAQLQELQNSNGWLVGAHSDTWAHHNMALSDQTASELATFVASNRNWLSTRGLRGYDFFAYPGGKSGGANLPIARQYYATARTVSAVLHETLPANDPHKLRVFVVGSGTTLAIAQAEVNAAIAGNYHLIMVFHDLATSGTGIMTTANFGAFVDWVATTTIAVKNMAEVLANR